MAAFFAYGDICHFNLTYPMGKKECFWSYQNNESREKRTQQMDFIYQWYKTYH